MKYGFAVKSKYCKIVSKFFLFFVEYKYNSMTVLIGNWHLRKSTFFMG